MRINEGFELMDVCGEMVVVALGKKNINFSKIISLNESAAYLWKKVVGEDFDAQRLAQLLTEEYDVDMDTALTDAQRTMDDWKSAGLAE